MNSQAARTIEDRKATSLRRDDTEIEAIQVTTAFANTVTMVGWTEFSLSAGVAERGEGGRVLLPVVDCGIYGTEKPEQLLWTGRIPLDNLAYMISQAASGIAEVIVPLAEMLAGSLKMPSGRLHYSAESLATAIGHLQVATAKLQELADVHLPAGRVEDASMPPYSTDGDSPELS